MSTYMNCHTVICIITKHLNLYLIIELIYHIKVLITYILPIYIMNYIILWRYYIGIVYYNFKNI